MIKLFGCLAAIVLVAVVGFLASLIWLVVDEMGYEDTEVGAW